MKKEQFEHAVRAAGAILGVSEVLVIGSQAIHGSIDHEFPEAERSIEVDIASLGEDADDKADLIDGSIGELSIFQETYGYYAQGVVPETAVLPAGWRKRLVPYCSPATNGVTALCLEPHDLWISKAIAGRPKDRAFNTALIERNLVDVKTLQSRLKRVVNLNSTVHDNILKFIELTPMG